MKDGQGKKYGADMLGMIEVNWYGTRLWCLSTLLPAIWSTSANAWSYMCLFWLWLYNGEKHPQSAVPCSCIHFPVSHHSVTWTYVFGNIYRSQLSYRRAERLATKLHPINSAQLCIDILGEAPLVVVCMYVWFNYFRLWPPNDLLHVEVFFCLDVWKCTFMYIHMYMCYTNFVHSIEVQHYCAFCISEF